MKYKRQMKLVFIITVSLIIGVISGAIIHEIGHGLAGIAAGGKFLGLWLWPGIQIYPKIHFDEWNFSIMGCVAVKGVESNWGRGFMNLMGSGTNAIASYLLACLALLLRSKKAALILFIVSLVFGWDIILYSTLPLIGLRHGVIVGGAVAEPLLAAQRMGIAGWLYFLVLACHTFIFNFLLFRIWKGKLYNFILTGKTNKL